VKRFWIFDPSAWLRTGFGFSMIGRQKARALRVSFCAFLCALCVQVEAQQPKVPRSVFRIGYLSSFDRASESARSAGIWLALRELGYIEGQNIAIEYRYAEGKRDRFPELAAELVHLKVDIILVAVGATIRAAKNATKTIPIVMAAPPADPVEQGLVESLARPGGNVTGVTNLTLHLSGKRLELLKEVVTKLAGVEVLYESANPTNVLELQEALPAVARTLGLTLRPRELHGPNELDKIFAALNKRRPDGLLLLGGPLIRANEKRIAEFALRNRLPLMNFYRDSVDAGGLMYYGADVAYSYRRVAYFVDKILKGAKPADLPLEQPTKFEFVINLKTAKQIGLIIPSNVLARADRVIR
jgi:putative tryptophan/tyrosine transport system substrate-binding protein